MDEYQVTINRADHIMVARNDQDWYEIDPALLWTLIDEMVQLGFLRKEKPGTVTYVDEAPVRTYARVANFRSQDDPTIK